MSEKEKQAVERIAQLPKPLKERFITLAEGAVMALEAIKEQDHGSKDDRDSGRA